MNQIKSNLVVQMNLPVISFMTVCWLVSLLSSSAFALKIRKKKVIVFWLGSHLSLNSFLLYYTVYSHG